MSMMYVCKIVMLCADLALPCLHFGGRDRRGVLEHKPYLIKMGPSDIRLFCVTPTAGFYTDH